jgi:hypothetical protein
LALNTKTIMGAIIAVAVGVYVFAAIFPGAASSLSNTTSWGTTPAAVITIGTVVFLIVAIVAVVNHFLGST